MLRLILCHFSFETITPNRKYYFKALSMGVTEFRWGSCALFVLFVVRGSLLAVVVHYFSVISFSDNIEREFENEHSNDRQVNCRSAFDENLLLWLHGVVGPRSNINAKKGDQAYWQSI